jgi:hypothetical protein
MYDYELTSFLLGDYRQLEKKAAKKADEGVVKLSPKGQAIETKSA